MFKIDVIYLRGELLLSHSWRPFKCMARGDAYNYISTLYYLFHTSKTPVYLYIEFKTGNLKVAPILAKYLESFESKSIRIVLGAGDRTWFSRIFQKRERLLREFYSRFYTKFHRVRISDFEKTEDIDRVDLFPKSIWNF